MAKRRRRETRDSLDAAAPQRPVALEAWMASQGVTWDTDCIRLQGGAPGCGGAALGVFAVKDIAEGDLLCTIPKSAVLSVRTTAFADMIEKERLGGGLGLIVACMAERAIGSKSKWHGYLASLPPREYLPIFWTEKELELLEGTELEHKAEADREATQSDFETDVQHLADKYKLPKSRWTLEDFRAVASWVASRAFYVDRWHGNSMVPLADIFNHKASVVELADGFAVAETADAHEDDEGEDDEGEDDEGDDQGEEEEEDGQELPNAEHRSSADDHQHCHRTHKHAHNGASRSHHDDDDGVAQQGGPAVKPGTVTELLTRPRIVSGDLASYERDGVNLRLEIGICSVERNGQEVLEIVAASPVAAGCEVHNTYGEHGNSELVNKYGFALERNPFNEVSVTPDEVLEAATATLLSVQQQGSRGSKASTATQPSASCEASVARNMRRRMRVISVQSSLLDPSSEPLLVMPGGCISKPLLLLMYVLLASEQQLHSWDAMEGALDEALGKDMEAETAEPASKPANFEHAVQLSSLPLTTLTPGLKSAFGLLFATRLARLPGTMAQTKAAIKAQSNLQSEHATAVRAALTLRLSEQSALQQAQEALTASRRP